MTTFEKSIILVTREKITKSNPKFFYYEIRSNAAMPSTPETIENSVSFLRYGTIVTTRPLKFNSAYILTAEQADLIIRLKHKYDGKDADGVLEMAA